MDKPTPPRVCVVCGGIPVWPTFGMCGVCVMGSAEYAGEPEPRVVERAAKDVPMESQPCSSYPQN